MKDFLMVCANAMLSVYIPFEIGRMLVEGVARREMAERVGLSDADTVARLGRKAWIVRGGVFVSLMRKDLCGLSAALFVAGMLTGAAAGYGWMTLLWFIELMALAAWIDWHRKMARMKNGTGSVSMNNQRKRRRLREAIREGAEKSSGHKRMTAH